MNWYLHAKNAMLRRIWTGSFRRKPCAHLDQIHCEECVALGRYLAGAADVHDVRLRRLL